MEKKTPRRLMLNRETIHRLDEPVLDWVEGGIGTISQTQAHGAKTCGCAPLEPPHEHAGRTEARQI